MSSGRLYVVATPIGNLEDMSPRAVETLRAVDAIAAEDTRHSRKLLTHFGIGTAVLSYHENNEEARASELLAKLEAGRTIALISDAGTPCVSDPGYRLVRAARQAGVDVCSVPGPSAVVSALSVSGLPTDRFTFHGFFPRKQSVARSTLSEMAAWPGTHVFYESARRLPSTLSMLADHLGDSEIAVARELTKIHEEVALGTPNDLCAQFSDPPKGECVVMVHVGVRTSDEPTADALRQLVNEAVETRGLSRRDAIRTVAKESGVPRNRVYAAAMERDDAS